MFTKVCAKYLHCPDAASRLPPAISFPADEDKRSYTVVSAATAWEKMNSARAAHVGLRQCLALGKGSAELAACSAYQDQRWVHKGLLMYYDRMELPFVVGRGTAGCSGLLDY